MLQSNIFFLFWLIVESYQLLDSKWPLQYTGSSRTAVVAAKVVMIKSCSGIFLWCIIWDWGWIWASQMVYLKMVPTESQIFSKIPTILSQNGLSSTQSLNIGWACHWRHPSLSPITTLHFNIAHKTKNLFSHWIFCSLLK